MNGAEIAVVIGAVAALAGLGWFFSSPRAGHTPLSWRGACSGLP
jgi:hypothetical protein